MRDEAYICLIVRAVNLLVGRSHTPTQRNTPSQRVRTAKENFAALEQSDVCGRSARGRAICVGGMGENGGGQSDFRERKRGRSRKRTNAKRNHGETVSEANVAERSEQRARASEPRCEQSDERSESCECVSAPRSTTCCASCGKVCASGVVEHTTDDGDTREAAGKLLCATTLSSFDAAIVTRRRRLMTSFAFPSGRANGRVSTPPTPSATTAARHRVRRLHLRLRLRGLRPSASRASSSSSTRLMRRASTRLGRSCTSC